MKSRKYASAVTYGAKYGRWTVIGDIQKNNSNRTVVACQCDCGTKKDVLVYNLVHHKTTQCKTCSSGKSPTYVGMSNRMYRGALRANVNYTLSPSQLSESFSHQSYSCALTGDPIQPSDATAIRWNAQEGMTPDNTLLVGKQIGSFLNSSGMDAKTFIGLVQTVVNNVQSTSAKNPIQAFFDRREKEC